MCISARATFVLFRAFGIEKRRGRCQRVVFSLRGSGGERGGDLGHTTTTFHLFFVCSSIYAPSSSMDVARGKERRKTERQLRGERQRSAPEFE